MGPGLVGSPTCRPGGGTGKLTQFICRCRVPRNRAVGVEIGRPGAVKRVEHRHPCRYPHDCLVVVGIVLPSPITGAAGLPTRCLRPFQVSLGRPVRPRRTGELPKHLRLRRPSAPDPVTNALVTHWRPNMILSLMGSAAEVTSLLRTGKDSPNHLARFPCWWPRSRRYAGPGDYEISSPNGASLRC